MTKKYLTAENPKIKAAIKAFDKWRAEGRIIAVHVEREGPTERGHELLADMIRHSGKRNSFFQTFLDLAIAEKIVEKTATLKNTLITCESSEHVSYQPVSENKRSGLKIVHGEGLDELGKALTALIGEEMAKEDLAKNNDKDSLH